MAVATTTSRRTGFSSALANSKAGSVFRSAEQPYAGLMERTVPLLSTTQVNLRPPASRSTPYVTASSCRELTGRTLLPVVPALPAAALTHISCRSAGAVCKLVRDMSVGGGDDDWQAPRSAAAAEMNAIAQFKRPLIGAPNTSASFISPKTRPHRLCRPVVRFPCRALRLASRR